MTSPLPWLLCVSLLACACGPATPADSSARFQQILVDHVRAPNVHHAVLHIDAPRHSLHTTWTHGDANPGQPLTQETPFLTASVGKLIIATATARLVSRGELRTGARPAPR